MRHFRRVHGYALTLFVLPVLLMAQQATGTPKIHVLNVGHVYTKDSPMYHFEKCSAAKRIKPDNRIVSKPAPEVKDLHKGSPR